MANQDEQLVKDAEDLGITVNGTWGNSRIQQEIDKKLLGNDSEGDDSSDDKPKTEDKPEQKGESMILKNRFQNPVNINGIRFKGKEVKTLTAAEVKKGGKKLNRAIEIKLLKKVKGA